MAERWKAWLTSRVAGALVGVFAGGLTVLVLEAAGHALFGTANPNDVSSVTATMFLSVLVAWIIGAGVGGGVATAWSLGKSYVPGMVVGLVLLAGAASNMFVMPHPWRMVVGAVALMPTAAYVATKWRVGAARA